MKITIIDEINAKMDAPKSVINHVISRTKLKVKGAHVTAAFKSGNWDGKESLVREDGLFFFPQLEEIFNALAELDIYEDHFDVEDMRQPLKHPDSLPPVELETFIEHGWTLRIHQKDALNAIIESEKGIISVATSGGKSGIMAATAKIYDPWYGSLTTTPSEELVFQLKDTYESFGIDVGVLTKAIKPKDREEFIKTTKHIITTNKIFLNTSDYFDGQQRVFLKDEVHTFGEKDAESIRGNLGDCPIRLGFTGTLPKKSDDEFKRNNIINHMGGGILIDIGVGYLNENNYISKFHVDMIKIKDSIGAEKFDEIGKDWWDWQMEEKHLARCQERIEEIATIVHKYGTENTLVLTRAELGRNLAEYMDIPFIDKDVKTKVRKEFFNEFDARDDYVLCGTFGCVGTGLDISRIFNLIIIDTGKNPTYIGQGIGRALRKDGDRDVVRIIDVYSDTHFSNKQVKERKKYYKQHGYPFNELEVRKI